MQKITLVIITLILLSSGRTYGFDIDDLEIHGFASTGYIKSDQNNFLLSSEEGSFEFNEAGLNISAPLANNFHAGLQLFSRDLGDVGNNNVSLGWAFLDYHRMEEIGLRLGKVKIKYGLYNDTRDYDMLRTSILLPQSAYVENLREFMGSSQGVEVYGNLSLGAAGRLGYNGLIGTCGSESNGGFSKLYSNTGVTLHSTTTRYIAGGRMLWYPPMDGLILGTTLYQLDLDFSSELTTMPADITSDIPQMRTLCFSIEYNYQAWTLAAEYSRITGDITSTMDLSQLGQPSPERSSDAMDMEGYYGMITYRFNNWFEVGAHYDVYYRDRDDRDGDEQTALGKPDYRAWQKDLSMSARFDITDFWLVKLEAHFIDGVALCSELDNPDGFDDQHWMLVAVKTTFNF